MKSETSANTKITKNQERMLELEKENALLKYRLASIAHFCDLANSEISLLDEGKKKGQENKNLDEYGGKPPQCWECGVKIATGHLCVKCATVKADPKQEPITASREVAKSYINERMTKNEDLISGTFGEYSKEELKKVECVECKQFKNLANCEYDYARNKYTCRDCGKRMKLEQEQAEEKARQEAINKMGDKNSKE